MCFVNLCVKGIIGYLFIFEIEELNINIFIIEVRGYVVGVYCIIDVVWRIGGCWYFKGVLIGEGLIGNMDILVFVSVIYVVIKV